MNVDVLSLIKRNNKMRGVRELHEPQWQDIADVILPRKSNITTSITQGQKLTEKLFDSTAVDANELLASQMHGSLTSNSSKWFSLMTRDKDVNSIGEVLEWLEECASRIYLALRQSNFDAEVQETYLDLSAFGTGCLLVEKKDPHLPGFTGLVFKSLANTEYSIAENKNGKVDTLFREFKLSARACFQMFGREVMKSEKIARALLDTPDKEFKILHCVYPREDFIHGQRKTNLPFASRYICLDDKLELEEGGYHEFPYCVPRWRKTSGEVYGRGPGDTALPDTKSLNKARELGFRAWAKAIDPPMVMENDGVVGNVKLQPAGLTVVRRKGQLEPFDNKARFDVSKFKEDELKASIRKIFKVDMIEAFLSNDTPQKTATEVQLRWELMQQILGPTLGRLMGELLNPLIERVFNIMYRENALPELPDVLHGRPIDIEYESPLARAQRAGELIAITRTYEFASMVQPIQEDIFDNFKHDDVVKHFASVTGMPMYLMQDDATKKKLRKAREQAKQEAQQAAILLEQAKAANQGASALQKAPGMGDALKESVGNA